MVDPPVRGERLSVTAEPVAYEVTGYPLHDINRDLWTIRVERRGENSWAVLRRSCCWNRRTKAWDYEPLPSSRTDAYKRTHRFPLEEALTIARQEATRLTVMGQTLTDAIKERQTE